MNSHGKTTISGAVTPAAPGKVVHLDRRSDPRLPWQKDYLAPQRLSNTSRYSWRINDVGVPGISQFRVRFGSATSRGANLWVYGWYWLSSRSPSRSAPYAAEVDCANYSIGGQDVDRTCLIPMETSTSGDTWFEWSVANCNLLQARIGLNGENNPAAQGNLTITNSTGKKLYSRDFRSPADVDANRTISITGAQRLRFRATAIDPGETGGSIGLGAGRMHCAGR